MFKKIIYNHLNRRINNVYNDNFSKNGKTPHGLFWNSYYNQIKRMEEILDILQVFSEKKVIKIADIGCGFGSMYVLIKSNPKYKNFLYEGVDINENFVEECKLSFGNEVNFFKGTFSRNLVDYSLMSGTYNYSTTKNINLWEEYIFLSLIECLKNSKKGIIFNLQVAIPTKISNNIFYADPIRIKKKFSMFNKLDFNFFKSLYFKNDMIFFIKKIN